MRVAAVLFLALLVLPASVLAETFELANGDKVSGQVLERTQDTISLENPVLGKIEIPVAQLAPEKPPRPGLFGTDFLAGWKRTFQLGFNGDDGNTTTSDLSTMLALRYDDESRRWRIDLAYFNATSDHDTTKSNGYLSVDRDWLLPGSRWFAFAGARGDYDAFRSWEYRVQGKGGIGYEFLKTDRVKLRARLGPSIIREFNADQFFVEALAALEGSWKINDKLSLEASNVIYPALNRLGEYRDVSSLAWKWKLAEDPALSLNLGVHNEYQSDVPAGNRHNDFSYFGTVGLDF